MSSIGIWLLIVQLGLSHPDVVYRQYQIESGYGKSWLATKNNNLFGMKCVKNRSTTQVGCVNGYGVYLSERECVIDMRLWQLSVGERNRADYLRYLRTVYIKDKKYLHYWFK